TPAGVALDFGTLVTGRDVITGESVPRIWAVAGIIPGVSELRKAGNALDGVVDAGHAFTSGQARREVMREQGIPTSQQPISQSRNSSGYEYQYEVPKSGGGTEIKSVQQQTLDSSHPGQGHWEAGSVKTDPLTGEVRMNDYGRPKLTNDKSKVNYD
ncbi:pre-toxin TG domain-containing protein, partial [Methylicorpusculum sp.]|uniref:pre-toxin TG domain-containing protein n=1 Tax=Methylicorpusculum sp. TaxID=2713644 RepID=UPI002ABA97A1